MAAFTIFCVTPTSHPPLPGWYTRGMDNEKALAPVLPLKAKKKAAKKYRPWTRSGATLGHIRGDTYWIDRTVHGIRHRVSTSCKTADAAYEEYKLWEQDPTHYAPRGTLRAGSGWEQAALAFLQFKENVESLSDAYLDELAAQLERFGEYRGFTSLDTFTQADIEAFLTDLVAGNLTGRLVNELDESGKPIPELDENGNPALDEKGRRKHKKKLVASERPREVARNRHLAALKSLMSWARDRDPPLTKNTADMKVRLAREDRNVRPPEPVETPRWKAVAMNLDNRWRAAQEALLGSGLRYGELARLTLDDIQPRGIIVRKAKRRKGRTVPVSTRTIRAVKKMLKLGGAPNDKASQMDHRLEAACRAAGVKRYTAHHLRHTYGTECLRNGMDIRTLQERLGHSDIKTTMRYLHAVRAIDGDDKNYAPV